MAISIRSCTFCHIRCSKNYTRCTPQNTIAVTKCSTPAVKCHKVQFYIFVHKFVICTHIWVNVRIFHICTHIYVIYTWTQIYTHMCDFAAGGICFILRLGEMLVGSPGRSSIQIQIFVFLFVFL